MSSSTLEARRKDEIAKYVKCYQHNSYKMGPDRVREWTDYLKYLEDSESDVHTILDVGCGRAESLDMAVRAGFGPVHGCEVVQDLVGGRVNPMEGIHCLPYLDSSYDLVSCQDVLEHILEDDVPAGLRELARVARRRIYISVAWFPSTWRAAGVHEELHICRHEAQWWMDQLSAATEGMVRVLKPYRSMTARFEVVLP